MLFYFYVIIVIGAAPVTATKTDKQEFGPYPTRAACEQEREAQAKMTAVKGVKSREVSAECYSK